MNIIKSSVLKSSQFYDYIMTILSYFKSKYITLAVQVVSVMKLNLNYEGANIIGLSYLISNLSYVLKKKN